jgi:hypothetical protein
MAVRCCGPAWRPLLIRRQAVSHLSAFTVPEPEPKVIKKHDLLTIIIREESEMTSDGKSDLKKNADLDARLDEWVSASFKNFAIRAAPGATSRRR